MSNDKMQGYVLDEFLEWMADECHTRGESYTLCIERDRFGRFELVWVQTSWVAWQASREALVIELPNRFSEAYQEYFDDVEGGCFNESKYISDLQENIEAAGVKVKP